MSKPENKGAKRSNVRPIRQEPAIIDPLPGWQPNSRYGLLLTDDTDSGRLVRLEEIALWLSERHPRRSVVLKLFSPLLQGDPIPRADESMLVLNTQTHPQGLLKDGRVNPALAGWWQFFPHIDHGDLGEFVVREIAEAWDRAWPGLADISTDFDARSQRAIARNRDRNTAAGWPEDEFLMDLLRAIAVPISLAHALWGWGQVRPVIAEAQRKPAPVEASQVTTWKQLVAYRTQTDEKGAPLMKGKPWAAEHRAIVVKERARRTARGDSSADASMGDELGVRRQAIQSLCAAKWEPKKMKARAAVADKVQGAAPAVAIHRIRK